MRNSSGKRRTDGHKLRLGEAKKFQYLLAVCSDLGCAIYKDEGVSDFGVGGFGFLVQGLVGFGFWFLGFWVLGFERFWVLSLGRFGFWVLGVLGFGFSFLVFPEFLYPSLSSCVVWTCDNGPCS